MPGLPRLLRRARWRRRRLNRMRHVRREGQMMPRPLRGPLAITKSRLPPWRQQRCPRWRCLQDGRPPKRPQGRSRGRRREAPPRPSPGMGRRALRSQGDAGQQAGAPLVAAISGRGGVGKSTLVASLAYCSAHMGLRAAVIDADLMFGNQHELFRRRCTA